MSKTSKKNGQADNKSIIEQLTWLIEAEHQALIDANTRREIIADIRQQFTTADANMQTSKVVR